MQNQYKSWMMAIFCSSSLIFMYASLHKAMPLEPPVVRIQKKSPNRIPSLVHFVVGQNDRRNGQNPASSTTSFTFLNYLVFLAARRQIRPSRLFVHYYQEPNTFWWKKMKQDAEINAVLVNSRRVETMFSRPVDHGAHRADIIRLEALMIHGGIYLDSDVLSLRSFDSLLNMSDVIMGYEDQNNKAACNAVILAKRNATFLRRWYDAYQSFEQKCWGCHSVILPARLALIYPDEIKVLSYSAFFKPTWKESNIFHGSNQYDFTLNYASHFWSKVNKHELDRLTPHKAMHVNTTFGRMLRHAIDMSTLIKLSRYFARNSTDQYPSLVKALSQRLTS
jgi:hypothetical protein